MSTFPSTVEFADVKDSPQIKMDLPCPLHLGTKILLDLTVRRKNGSRTEELRIAGEFKVTSSTLDVRSLPRQIVQVEATKIAPVWRSVKTPTFPKRKPPPAISPRTVA